MTLLLASRSAARQAMLTAAGVPSAPVEAPFDEEEAKHGFLAAGFGPRDLAEMLARMKAASVAAPGDAWVLGADQVLETEDGGVLGKAGSPEELTAQLQALSGRTHLLHSAAALVRGGEAEWSSVETVRMHMRPLADAFIRDYVLREWDAVRWSVGGYHVEGRGVQLFEAIEGSHFAVLGLPLLPLLGALRTRGLVPS
jgi:septum formation protein